MFFCSGVLAQTPQENLNKYLYYRNRLNADFTYLGEGQGKGLVAGQRAYGSISSNILKFGDATINLGWHLSILATEYKLLKNNNQNTDKTVEEIYYLLQTLNRLDATAESYFRCATCAPTPQAGDLNGFFIRDDVPFNFLQSQENYTHFNQHIHSEKTVSVINSDFSATDTRDKEESHDQVWHLLMGLALTADLLEDNIKYSGVNLQSESREIAHRLMNYIIQNDWMIFNPVTGTLVKRGESARLLSYGANKAGKTIDIQNSDLYTLDSLSNLPSYKNLWQAYQNVTTCVFPPPAIDLCKEYYKILVLATIGHSWINPLTGTNTTAEKVNYFSKILRYEHFPLLNAVLNENDPVLIADTLYERLLNTAPANGPYNYGYPANSTHFEWSTGNRFSHPERRGYNSSSGGSFFPGEYNGLDYMLIFNLFVLHKGSDYLNNYTTEIDEKSSEGNGIQVSFFPNPFSDYLNIYLSHLPADPVTFTFYDIVGKEIKSIVITKTIQKIYRENLNAGVYLYKIQSGSQVISTGKIVVH